MNEKSEYKLFSKEWTNIVVGMLDEDEKFKDRPKTMGLLRIAEQLCERLSYRFISLKMPSNNDLSATVNCEIACGAVNYENKKIRGSFSTNSACDVNEPNSGKFCKYATASASTMALGRALKLLLGINVYTAEEIGSDNFDEPTPQTNQKISDQQRKAIDRIVKLAQLNLGAILEGEFKTSEDKLSTVSMETAKQIIVKLKEYQTSKKVPTKYKTKTND